MNILGGLKHLKYCLALHKYEQKQVTHILCSIEAALVGSVGPRELVGSQESYSPESENF